MKLINKYIIEKGKVCFHCKKNESLPKRGVCQGCSNELESWRNKKEKKQSEEKL